MKVNLQMFDALKVRDGKLDLGGTKTCEGKELKAVACYNRFIGFFLSLMGFAIQVRANESEDRDVVYLKKSDFIDKASELLGKDKNEMLSNLHDTVMNFFAQMREDRRSRWEYALDRTILPTMLTTQVKERVDAFEESLSGLELVKMMIEIENTCEVRDFSEANRIAENIDNPSLKALALQQIEKAQAINLMRIS